MLYLVISFIVFAIILFFMAIGVILRNKPLKGSCGGLSTMFGKCLFCDKKENCKKQQEESSTYDTLSKK